MRGVTRRISQPMMSGLHRLGMVGHAHVESTRTQAVTKAQLGMFCRQNMANFVFDL